MEKQLAYIAATLLVLGLVTADALPHPSFVGTIANVTINVGRDAEMSCQVKNLRSYKVAWVQVDTQTILTIHDSVITRNPRVGLSSEGSTIFRLHLKDVVEKDRGFYMCQINTDPMINQDGYLEVVVPPDFEETSWPGDLVVRENINVSLECRANGYPPPTVTWRKEDSNDPNNYVVVGEGEVHNMVKVSRLDMGAYLCVASNGIQPSVSKRTMLKVQFPPMLWIPNQLEGAKMGGQITLECNTEAYPRSINYWTNHRGEMIADGGMALKYETVTREDSYKTHMKLTIKDLTIDDFTTYKCIAKNSLGETDGSIKLYELYPSKSEEASTESPDGEDHDGDGQGEEDGDYNQLTNSGHLPDNDIYRKTIDDNKLTEEENKSKNNYRKKHRLRGNKSHWSSSDLLNNGIYNTKKSGTFAKNTGLTRSFEFPLSFDSQAPPLLSLRAGYLLTLLVIARQLPVTLF